MKKLNPVVRLRRALLSSFSLILVLICLMACSQKLPAQSVIRGPYLQLATDSSIILRWRTDVATDSRVRYGSSPTNLSLTASDVASTTEHSIEIGGLTDYTQYYYAVGTSGGDLAGADSTYFFKTHPTPGTVQPIRIWVIGDFGKGNSEQMAVRDSYKAYADTSRKADVWLWMGDNAYDNGEDQEYQAKVFNIYPEIFRNHVFWPTPGNHDYNSVNRLDPPLTHTGPYYDIVDVPQNAEAGGVASGTEVHYSYDYGNVHFVSLNSEVQDWISSSNTPMTTWLHNDLSTTTQKWKVVYFHQPPHTKGSHDSDDFWELFMTFMRVNIMPICEQYGVDLILCGHSHVYERSYLVKGHFGNSGAFDINVHALDAGTGNFNMGEAYVKYLTGPNANQGTVYAVVGNSGSKTSSPDLDHPMLPFTYGCDTCIGSLIIDVNGDRLDAIHLGANNQIVDEFTILKVNSVAINEPEQSLLSNVDVYPNPFADILNVSYGLTGSAKLAIHLYDLQGKEVYRRKIGRMDAGQHTFEIPAGELARGTYLIRFHVGKEVHAQRVVKLN